MIKFPHTYSHQEKLRLAHALFLVVGQAATNPVIDWLRSEKLRLEHDNTWEPDADVIRQRQGVLQTLESILAEFENANETYHKLKENE